MSCRWSGTLIKGSWHLSCCSFGLCGHCQKSEEHGNIYLKCFLWHFISLEILTKKHEKEYPHRKGLGKRLKWRDVKETLLCISKPRQTILCTNLFVCLFVCLLVSIYIYFIINRTKLLLKYYYSFLFSYKLPIHVSSPLFYWLIRALCILRT